MDFVWTPEGNRVPDSCGFRHWNLSILGLRTTWLPLLADYDSYAILSHVLHVAKWKNFPVKMTFIWMRTGDLFHIKDFGCTLTLRKRLWANILLMLIKLYLCLEKVLEDLCTITRWLNGPGKDDSTGTM